MRVTRYVFILWFVIAVLALGNNVISASGKKDTDAVVRWYQSILSKNWLIHVRLEIPPGWKMGTEDILGASAEFPDLPYVGSDFAIISKVSDNARIAVFYYPVMGRGYYERITANFIRQYETQLDLRYKNFADRNKGATILTGARSVTNLDGKEYHVLRRELRGFPFDRSIYYYIQTDSDMKSVVIFALSIPNRENNEDNSSFRQFLHLVRTHSRMALDPISEVLSRSMVKEWLANNEKLYNAICDAAIRETEEALIVIPDSWILHYHLASLYSARYVLPEESNRPSEIANMIVDKRFASNVINFNAAVVEYRKVLTLIPENIMEVDMRYFGLLPENLAQVYGEFSSLLLSNAEYDETIQVLQEGISRIPAQKQKGLWSRERLCHELGLAYRQKADAYVLKNQFDLALANYEKALEYVEHSQKYSVWEKKGDMYRRVGDYAKATAAYRLAIDLYRENNMGVSNYVVKELEKKMQAGLERN